MQRTCLTCSKHARHAHICSCTWFPYLLLYFQLTVDLLPFIVRRPFTIHLSFAVRSGIGSWSFGIVCPWKRFNDSRRSAGENRNGGEHGRKEGCSAAGVFVGSVFLLLAGIRSGDLRGRAENMMDGYGGPGK
ncbi:hypothetical protein HOY80DRAFT_956532 [Tuber brumale]|nr:hypothetical protein HOY80DRAFT_956532 [Tuber brumale]